MPFEFLKRKGAEAEPGDRGPAGGSAGSVTMPFDALTDEWRFRGVVHSDGRLSDALNRRAELPITDVSWAPVDGSAAFSPVAGVKTIDPYDLILVLAAAETLPPRTEDERSAHKVHKVPFDVAIEAPPFRVFGTVYLRPGAGPEQLLDRATEMFVPVVGGTAVLGEAVIVGTGDVDTILVNRFSIRGIDQIDLTTGERPVKLPGQPLGGTTWQERAR